MLNNPFISAANSGINGLDWINLFSAATSIVLAIVALALSIFFFVQGKNSADKSARSAEEISANVKRLDIIFNTLYSGIFKLMRETVTDMRQHVWKSIPGSESADNKRIKEAEAESQAILAELDKVSKRVGLADAKIGELKSELAPVLMRALEEQRQVAEVASVKRIESSIIRLIQDRPSNLRTLVTSLPYPEQAIVDAVVDLNRRGIVAWGDMDSPYATFADLVRYINPSDRNVVNEDNGSPDSDQHTQ